MIANYANITFYNVNLEVDTVYTADAPHKAAMVIVNGANVTMYNCNVDTTGANEAAQYALYVADTAGETYFEGVSTVGAAYGIWTSNEDTTFFGGHFAGTNTGAGFGMDLDAETVKNMFLTPHTTFAGSDGTRGMFVMAFKTDNNTWDDCRFGTFVEFVAKLNEVIEPGFEPEIGNIPNGTYTIDKRFVNGSVEPLGVEVNTMNIVITNDALIFNSEGMVTLSKTYPKVNGAVVLPIELFEELGYTAANSAIATDVTFSYEDGTITIEVEVNDVDTHTYTFKI